MLSFCDPTSRLVPLRSTKSRKSWDTLYTDHEVGEWESNNGSTEVGTGNRGDGEHRIDGGLTPTTDVGATGVQKARDVIA